jgi:hypothetical protein
MQKLILFFSLIFSFQTAIAQQLTVSSTFASQQGRSSEEITASVLLKNNSNQNMELRWERVRNNLPSGWDAVVCDKQCYSTLIDSRTFSLAPGESISDFRVSFRPNGVEGIGNVEVKIYEIKKPSNNLTLNFSGSAQHSGISSFSGNNTPSVYPNPAIDYIQIQDVNDVKYLEVYNALGRKISDFSVSNNGKYDVSDLPRGMYMVRMLDKHKNIIRTQRISKTNP